MALFSLLVFADMCPIVRISSHPRQIEKTTVSSGCVYNFINSKVLKRSLHMNWPLLSSLDIVSDIFKIYVKVVCFICFELAKKASIRFSSAPDITSS